MRYLSIFFFLYWSSTLFAGEEGIVPSHYFQKHTTPITITAEDIIMGAAIGLVCAHAAGNFFYDKISPTKKEFFWKILKKIIHGTAIPCSCIIGGLSIVCFFDSQKDVRYRLPFSFIALLSGYSLYQSFKALKPW